MEQQNVSPTNNNVLEPRVRSINFTAQEKRVLTSLIAKHPSINTKYCDNGSLSAKHISWHEVYDKFCCAFPVQPLRDIKQLKGCWKRLKMKRKLYPYEPNKWFGADDSSSEVVMLTPVKVDVDGTVLVDPANNLQPMLSSSGSNDGSSYDNVNHTSHADSKPVVLTNNNIESNIASANGTRINDVASMLRDFVTNNNKRDVQNDNEANHIDASISRRKTNTPRRLPVRPLTSYMRPPVSTLSGEQDTNDDANDVFLEMTRREHQAKMRILKLKEWKLRHQCMNLKIGLPPDYIPDSEEDDDL